MEIIHYTLILVSISIILIFSIQQKKKIMPPSPPAFPIIGHLYLLKRELHLDLQALSDKYGPMMYLRIGNRPTVVVSSPSIAEDCFTKNDKILANRPDFLFTRYAYNGSTLGSTSYGDYWRNIRRISTIHIFSSLSVQRFSFVWTEEVRLRVKKLISANSNIESWKELNLTTVLKNVVEDSVMRLVCGNRWSSAADAFKLPNKLMNVCDYVPILRWIGFGGIEKSIIDTHAKRDKFLQNLLDEERKKGQSLSTSDKQRTIVQVLLSLQEADPEYYTDEVVKGVLLTMFTAGMDTSTLTMHTVMLLLINNPEVLEKARKEIEKEIGKERLIEDSDFPKLTYLRCVINEALRLYTPTPILVPHYASEDCTINGYKIPRDTMVLINAWAIHRDPKVWEEPTKFKPERFEGIEAGSDQGFKFIPFGKGRRTCPGNTLATRFVALAVGTLIQCFEWKMSEEEKTSDKKYDTLVALYRPCQSMIYLTSKTPNLFS